MVKGVSAVHVFISCVVVDRINDDILFDKGVQFIYKPNSRK